VRVSPTTNGEFRLNSETRRHGDMETLAAQTALTAPALVISNTGRRRRRQEALQDPSTPTSNQNANANRDCSIRLISEVTTTREAELLRSSARIFVARASATATRLWNDEAKGGARTRFASATGPLVDEFNASTWWQSACLHPNLRTRAPYPHRRSPLWINGVCRTPAGNQCA
jgi:hypothetical protein